MGLKTIASKLIVLGSLTTEQIAYLQSVQARIGELEILSQAPETDDPDDFHVYDEENSNLEPQVLEVIRDIFRKMIQETKSRFHSDTNEVIVKCGMAYLDDLFDHREDRIYEWHLEINDPNQSYNGDFCRAFLALNVARLEVLSGDIVVDTADPDHLKRQSIGAATSKALGAQTAEVVYLKNGDFGVFSLLNSVHRREAPDDHKKFHTGYRWVFQVDFHTL